MHEAEVAVVGLGIVGAMTLWRLARAGVRTIGVEQSEPGHHRGASHGGSRIFRTLSWEGEQYPPLARRSAEVFRELEQESGDALLSEAFCAVIGPLKGELITSVLASAQASGTPIETLDAGLARTTFPQFCYSASDALVVERSAGVINPEASVKAAVRTAVRRGARILAEHEVLEVRRDGSGVQLIGEHFRVHCGSVVVATGGWASCSPGLASLQVQARRSPLAWFRPREEEIFKPPAMPVFVRDTPCGRFWGIPDVDGKGVKVGAGSHPLRHPDMNSQIAVTTLETAAIQQFVTQYIPGLEAGDPTTEPCMDGYAEDREFVIGPTATDPRIVLAVGMSGHGFKHAGAVAEMAAAWAAGRTRPSGSQHFTPDRIPSPPVTVRSGDISLVLKAGTSEQQRRNP